MLNQHIKIYNFYDEFNQSKYFNNNKIIINENSKIQKWK